MATGVVYSATNGADVLQGQMFHGMKFWLSAKVPQRSRFIDDIKANGGAVVQLEKNADVMIVDHKRKEALPGTHSYTFIEKSIREGALQDLAKHAVGPAPGTVRNVASVTHPASTIRKKYTQEDERILWDWVNTNPQTGGGTDGNEIYKQLEMKHPQHPWQSWRDHYRKSMKGRTRPIYPPNNAPPTPPSEMLPADTGLAQGFPADDHEVDEFESFSEGDEEVLMDEGRDIVKIPTENLTAAWTKWAGAFNVEKKHSAGQWQAFWERRVLPRFLRRESKMAQRNVDTEEASSERPVADVQPIPRNPPSDKPRDHAPSPQRAPRQRAHQPQPRSTGSPVLPVVQIQEPIAADGHNDDIVSPLGNSILKRKRPVIEELPSSSPPSTVSPSRVKRTARNIKEIASTPDHSPRHYNEDRYQPLALGDLLEANAEDTLGVAHEGGSSPLGQQPSDTLSEPDRTVRASTQALLRADTPYIDFDVPPPDGGWSDDEQADHADKSESEYGSASEQPFVTDTQAILQGETQIPDLTVPDPDNPWLSLIPPPSPPLIMASSPVAASESSSAQQARLDEKIDRLLENRIEQGFPAEQILAVLDSTCTDISLTEDVLEQMGPQNGAFNLPNDVKGVWTAQDDRDLRSSDARKVDRLDPKHGADGVNARYEWLELMDSKE